MKKRVFLLCMLLIGLVSFSACGKEEPVSGEITPGGKEVVVSGEVAPNNGSDGTAELADTPLAIGRVEGGVYTNEYIGIAAALNENWAFYTAEELQELPGLANDAFEGTELGELAKEMEHFTDMQAENVNDLTVLSIGYQHFDLAARLTYAQMTEEEIVDVTLDQKDMLIEAYTQGGIDTECIEKKNVRFLGKEHCALYTVASVEGTPCYILQLYAYNLGEWGVTMTFTSYVEDKTESLLDLFYKI